MTKIIPVFGIITVFLKVCSICSESTDRQTESKKKRLKVYAVRRPTSARDGNLFKLVTVTPAEFSWPTSRPTRASFYASLLFSSVSAASRRPGSDMLADIFRPDFCVPSK